MPDNISKHNKSLSCSERSEQARQAGKASGRVRRARAKLIELSKSPSVMAYLDERLDDTTITAIADALISAAKNGNLNAMRYIFSLEDALNDYDPEPADNIVVVIRHCDEEEESDE